MQRLRHRKVGFWLVLVAVLIQASPWMPVVGAREAAMPERSAVTAHEDACCPSENDTRSADYGSRLAEHDAAIAESADAVRQSGPADAAHSDSDCCPLGCGTSCPGACCGGLCLFESALSANPDSPWIKISTALNFIHPIDPGAIFHPPGA